MQDYAPLCYIVRPWGPANTTHGLGGAKPAPKHRSGEHPGLGLLLEPAVVEDLDRDVFGT
jgi:hypothetical protein